MKKSTKKPLRLAAETLRRLDSAELVHAAGGRMKLTAGEYSCDNPDWPLP